MASPEPQPRQKGAHPQGRAPLQSRTRSLVLCALSLALTAVLAAIIVPFGPIPFTLQSLMIMLMLLILTPKEAVATIGGYLLLGALGLPVFSGFTGGLGVLLGPTGGFLMGFLVGVVLASLLRGGISRRIKGPRGFFLLDIASLMILVLAYYALGLFWFWQISGTTITTAFTLSVLPFLIPDALKAIAAFTCAKPIRAALGRARFSPRNPPGET